MDQEEEMRTSEKEDSNIDLVNRVKNLEKIATELFNKLKPAENTKDPSSNEKQDLNNVEEKNCNCEDKSDSNTNISNESDAHEKLSEEKNDQYFNELKEINEKLDKILATIKGSSYEKIEEMLKEVLNKLDNIKRVDLSEEALNQISDKIKRIYDSSKTELIEKLDTILENTNSYSSKLDKLSNDIDVITEKIDRMSEKVSDLIENGGVRVVDVIKLIKEIYKGINDIKELLNNCDDEGLDKAIEIVDDINNKIDSYLAEIEEGLKS